MSEVADTCGCARWYTRAESGKGKTNDQTEQGEARCGQQQFACRSISPTSGSSFDFGCVLDGEGEIFCGLKAVVQLLLKTATHHTFEGGRDFFVARRAVLRLC